MKIGLFFGSFNPVHVGHMIIANHMAWHTDLDEVWMVVSPHNPLKSKASLAGDYDRLNLVRLAIGDNSKIKASSIEFDLPQPSYTIDTLTYLREKHPNKQFSLIMGGDNLATLHKWKNYEVLLRDYTIYVYNRPGSSVEKSSTLDGTNPTKKLGDDTNIIFANAPLLDISATYIRNCIRKNLSVRYMLPDDVYEEIMKSNMYKKSKESNNQ